MLMKLLFHQLFEIIMILFYLIGSGSTASASPLFGSTSSGRSSSNSPAKPTRVELSAILELQFPLQNEYDFMLACSMCFIKIGEGVRGYKLKENFGHMCIKDYLLLKLKDRPNVNWMRVRFRPDTKFTHFNTYKVCQQFTNSEPCKIGTKCTFPHGQAELRLWTLEKDGHFDIQQFIAKLNQLKIGKICYMFFLYCTVVV